MKSKTMFFGAAATAIALSAATISASPAQALTITPGSILNFGGGTVEAGPNNAAPTQFVFDAPFPQFGGGPGKTVIFKKGSTGSFAGLDRYVPIRNLTLTPLGGKFFSSGPVANFITDIGTGISFDLTKFIYDNSKSSATFEGIFRRSGTDFIAAKGGLFTSQLTDYNSTSYSASIRAVPTPALLPGLIGLGMGMLRKRKREMAAANAES